MKIISFCVGMIVLVVLSFGGSAQVNIANTLSKLRGANDDTNKVNLYRDAIEYYKRSNPDSAFALAEAGLKVAISIKSSRAEGFMLWQLGSIDRVQGRLVTAGVRFNEAHDIYQRLGERKYVAILKNELGVIEGIKGNYDAATKQFYDALKIYESLGDTLGIGQTYIKLGVVNESLNNLEKADTFYKMAFEKSRSIGDSVNMAFLYNNMGILEGKREHNTESLQYFHKGLAMCTGSRFTDVHISLLLNCGIANERFGNELTALANYDTALKIARDHNMQFDVPNILLNMALLDHAVSRDEKMPLMREALRRAKETDQKNLEANIYTALADFSFENGSYKDAYLYQDTANKIEKKIFSVQKNSEIANLESLYELDKSRNKVMQLEETAKQGDFQRNVIIGIAVIMLIVLVFFMLLYQKTVSLNSELKEGKRQLAEANKTKDVMFSIIGHDLRAPTHSILGMLNVLQSNKQMAEDEKAEVYKLLKEQSQASLDTLNKLLLWGSRQIKGINILMENFDVGDIIESNTRLLQDSASEKQLTIVNKVPVGVSVYADSSHFDFVFRNLLANAIKFSKKKGIIETGVAEKKASGFVVFYVKDHGIGIKKDMIERIFGLGNISRTGTENERGTGLGLVLCKDFVEQDGGTIWVESEVGQGSVFFFSLREPK